MAELGARRERLYKPVLQTVNTTWEQAVLCSKINYVQSWYDVWDWPEEFVKIAQDYGLDTSSVAGAFE